MKDDQKPDDTGVVQEFIPPSRHGAKSKRVVLTTVGHVSSEMARVYRQVRRGEITVSTGTRLTYILSKLLEAKKVELAFALAAEDPDRDRPALVGLTIKGPAPALAEGTPVRRLNVIEVKDIERAFFKSKGKKNDA